MAATAAGEGAACPAYPWPHDGAQRGRKVFMQSDCAACHSMLPYASLTVDGNASAAEATVAEIVVSEAAAAPPAPSLHAAANPPDLTRITQELKKRAVLASPVWMRLLLPHDANALNAA